ncbi:MAG: hypothetical protein ACHQ6T_06085 [Myxococcota bacterium]
MAFPDVAALSERFASDRELALAARFWHGALHLGAGSQRVALRFEPGRTPRVDPDAGAIGARDVEITAAAAEWEKLTAPIPPPFYQDVFGAALHHPVSLGGDFETLYAYYPAIRRVIELMREARA